MTVVLDTNVLLSLFGKAGRHRPLREAIARGHVRWAVSTSVLFEYEEILVARSGRSRWEALLRFIYAVSLRHGTILFLPSGDGRSRRQQIQRLRHRRQRRLAPHRRRPLC